MANGAHRSTSLGAWTAGTIALALLGVSAALALRSGPASPPLDSRFPARPAAADLAALRKAYTGPPATWPRPRLLKGARFTEMAPLAIKPPPRGEERDLARLGAELFEDPRLSASGHFSCQSCHNRRLGWGDGLPTPFGHGRAKGKRNAQALFTVGYKSPYFWDGRSTTLEAQALAPLTDHREMANDDVATLLARINAVDRYRAAFAALTGREDITVADITGALAAFQRTLERTTRFDRFLQGDAAALTDTEVWGLHLFRTKAGCANCHSGPTLSDGGFHNLGLSFFGRRLEDLGRYGVTGETRDAGRFLTPPLRHVSKTAPYMHNGIFPTLDGLVRFYEAGGGRVRPGQAVAPERQALAEAATRTSPQLQPFELTPEERAAIVAYLDAL